jgi:DNA primase
VELARLNTLARDWFVKSLTKDPAGATALGYARDRGFTDETIAKFGLGYAPDRWDGLLTWARQVGQDLNRLVDVGLVKPREKDEGYYDAFRHRLIFPIVGAMERTVGFGGRALSEGQCTGPEPAKYLNSPESAIFDKRRTLYGLPAARSAIERMGRALIVEGYTDCMMAHQHGVAETVATLGTAFSVEHADLLSRFTDRVVLMFDADEAGQAAAQRALRISLAQQLEVRLACIPDGLDPCDYLRRFGQEAFTRLIDQAEDALDYNWRRVEQEYRSEDGPRARRRAVEAFVALLGDTAHFEAWDAGSAIGRQIILDRVARLVGLDNKELMRLFRQHHRRERTRSVASPASGNVVAETPSRPAQAHQVALREVLEVSLNDSGYLQQAGALFAPEWFDDEHLRTIGQTACELARSVGAFRLGDVLARIEAPATARCAVALQVAGERRGNYEATVNGAVSCLRAWRARQESASQTMGSQGDEDARLRAAEARGRSNQSFAPPRWRAQSPGQ